MKMGSILFIVFSEKPPDFECSAIGVVEVITNMIGGT